MKLKKIRVQNFRCVEDSQEFTVSDVTCLVGKNESGKTALLAAIEKLNAVNTARGKFLPLDYPRRKWRPEEPLANEPATLTTTWELSEEELNDIEAQFGAGALKSRIVVFSKAYDNLLRVNAEWDEPAMVNGLIAAAALTAQDRAALALTGNTFKELAEAVAKITETDGPLAELKRLVPARVPEGQKSLVKHLQALLPKVLYFGDYYKLAGQVSLTDFLQRKAQSQQKASDLLFDALLGLAGTTPENIQKLGKFEDLNAALRAVSNQISDEIFAYWTQNKYLDVDLKLDAARPQDPAPFNEGFVFRTRIDNRRHRVDTSFDDRSSGFTWFFSFLVWFSQLKKTYGKRLLILLDEPGLTLHARAQKDLLRYFNERLTDYQVIYTTHSPFMVDPDNLLSARTVEDVVTKDGNVLGTKVGDRVLSMDPDTISPLQRALDYEFTQTLFVGRNSLLVEGPSDLLYLKWFSNQLKQNGRTSLDYRWTICVTGGVDRVPGFASLFRGNGLRIAAVTDVAAGAKQRIENARKAIGDDRVLTLDKFASQTDADIEDVMGRDFYAALVNETFRLSSSDKFKPQAGKGRVVPEVETHFKTLPPRYEEFDHYKPAAWLVDTEDAGVKLKGFDVALDRMEALVKEINGLI